MEKKTVSVTDAENGRPQAHVNNNDVFVFRVDDDPRNRRGEGGDNFSNNCESNAYKTVGARRKHRQEEPKRCDSTTKAFPAFSAGKNTQRTVPTNYANNQYFDNKNRLGGLQTSSLSQLHAYDSDESEEIGEISSVTFNRTNPSGMAFESVEPELHTSGTQDFTEAVQQLGELTIDELPPVTIPQTEVQPEECELVGYISNIVNKLSTYLEIMVKSLPNQPVFNIDTLLFIEKGKQPLGYIFDVIGQVSSPQYIIRYNTPEEIEDLFVEVGTPVYSAPKTEHSQYVFVQQLMKQKGTDASWKHDYEAPPEHQDFSDDEQECKGAAGPSNAKERHRDFEKDMNLRNLLYSQLHNPRDLIGPTEHRPYQQHAYGPQPQPNQDSGPSHDFGPQPSRDFGPQPPHDYGAPPTHDYGNQPPQERYQQPQFQQQQQMPMHQIPMEPNFRPTVSNARTFPPPFPMHQYRPPLVPYCPQFVPNIPAPQFHFASGPSPPSTRPVQPRLQFNFPQRGVRPNVDMFGNMPQMMPPTTAPPPMMYPVEMGLPRCPPSQPVNYVPNMPYYNAAPVMWNNFTANNTQQQVSPGNNQQQQPPPQEQQASTSEISAPPRFYLPPPN